jgi:hypothetical protein
MKSQFLVTEAKITLKQKLKKLTKTFYFGIYVDISAIKSVKINLDYDLRDFYFLPGSFVYFDGKVGIVAGVGKGEFDEELWFLFEGSDGISYIPGARMEFFKEKFIKLRALV